MYDPADQPSKILPHDWYRLLKILAVHEAHIAHLYRQTHNTQKPDLDNILKKMADDFGIPYETLRDVKLI